MNFTSARRLSGSLRTLEFTHLFRKWCMGFLKKKHKELITKLEEIWEGIQELNKLGNEFGIDDIFQDNGAKILQQVIYMNFTSLKDREGNDAVDINGIEWELKSANEEKVSGVSTHHHLNGVILKKYRSVPWMFALYSHTKLNEIIVMTPDQLEPLFSAWENHIGGRKIKNGTPVPAKDSLNNPKIPIKFIRQNGIKVYPFSATPVDPASIAFEWKNKKKSG